MPKGFVTLDASPSVLGSRAAGAAILEHWLPVAAPDLHSVSIDLVSDIDDLPLEVEDARAHLSGLREPSRSWVPWRRGQLRRLPSIDPGNPEALAAAAAFAYWSIDVQIVIAADRYVEFFSSADTGQWATYNLPEHQLGDYATNFPSTTEPPASWASVFA